MTIKEGNQMNITADEIRKAALELTKRRAAKEHDRNLGSGFYKMGYMDGFDDAIKIVTEMEDKNA